MAATTFKQQCPSCEAMVPIRDPKLIGRKIDCPKCKYRFVVEEPADEADEAPASGKRNGKAQQAVTARRPVNAKGALAAGAGVTRRDAEEEEEGGRPAPKKGGSSTILILGIGLGAVALVLLAVVIIVVVSSGGDKPAAKPPSNANTASNSGNENKDPEQPAAIQLSDATNYLPNAAEMVKTIRVDKVLDSTVGQAAFQTPGAFSQEAFQQKFGFPLENVTQIVHASSESQDWVFNVMRLDPKKQTLAEPDLVASLAASLKLKTEEKKLESGLEYYQIDSYLDSFSFLYLTNRKARTLFLHVLDKYTLVLASEKPMQDFLKDNRQPKLISEAPAKVEQDQDPDAAPKGPDNNPPSSNPNPGRKGGGPPGPGVPGPGAGGPQTPGSGSGPLMPQTPNAGSGGPMPPMGPGGFSRGPGAGSAPPPPPSASGSYLTVSRELKSMMDKLTLPEDPKQPVLICMAMNAKTGQELLSANLNLPGVDVSQFLVERARDLQIIGACLKAFNHEKLTLVIGIDCKSDSVAHKLDADARELLPTLSKSIEDKLDLTVNYAGKTPAPGTNPQTGFSPFGPPGGLGPQRPRPGGGSGSGPPGGGNGSSPPPGAYGPQMMRPGGGSGSGPPAGFGPGMPPGGFRGAGAGGGMPEGMPGGGRFGGFPGGPNSAAKEEETESSVSVSRSENTVLLTINLIWKKTIPDTLYATLQQRIAHAKGLADMSAGSPKIHDLAAAVKAYSEEKKQFPRGTADRRSTTDRAGLPFRPDQRVSWLVELLPYLGDKEYKPVRDLIDDQQSWRDAPAKKIEARKNNVVAAETVIPYFLSADSPETSWWAPYPGLDRPVASTHFVGIAGVGMDAAEYSAKDPSVAKKLGVFGYDRVTKLEDIKDGLENTIVALQVPTEVKSAWLAGGGSTVRGVPETDPILPFVCAKDKQGRLGTFAIMADCRVRFIPKDINPDTFKAMCTINGGETIENLDEVAPVVPGGSKPVLKPQLPPTVVVPEAKPPVDGAKPPADQPSDGWSEFTHEEGQFTVLVPKGVAKKTHSALQGGVAYLCSAVDGDQLYIAGSGSVAASLKLPEVEKIYDEIRDNFIKASPGAKATNEKVYSYDGNPGREIYLEVSLQNQKGPWVMRVFRVKDRIYLLETAGPANKFNEQDKNRFFDSFKLLKK